MGVNGSSLVSTNSVDGMHSVDVKVHAHGTPIFFACASSFNLTRLLFSDVNVVEKMIS